MAVLGQLRSPKLSARSSLLCAELRRFPDLAERCERSSDPSTRPNARACGAMGGRAKTPRLRRWQPACQARPDRAFQGRGRNDSATPSSRQRTTRAATAAPGRCPRCAPRSLSVCAARECAYRPLRDFYRLRFGSATSHIPLPAAQAILDRQPRALRGTGGGKPRRLKPPPEGSCEMPGNRGG
jgi:hypothetical protein